MKREGKEQTSLTEAEFDRLFKFYTEAFTFYNKSLDLMRKVMVYFPADKSEDQAELIALYLSLGAAEKQQLIESLRAKEKSEPKPPGKVIGGYGPKFPDGGGNPAVA